MQQMIQHDMKIAALAAGAATAETEAAQKKQEGESLASNVLDGVAGAADAADLAMTVCKAGGDALRPDFTTGGVEAKVRFVTGGGDGAANTFQTVADCTPVTDASDAADLSAVAEGAGSIMDAGAAVIDGVGTVIGGLFDGLGSL